MGASSDRSNGLHGAGRLRLGEVIETSTVRIWVESDRLHELPPLGAVVGTSSQRGHRIYAIVSYAQTAGIDETRRAIRRGSAEVRDEEVYRRHPELAHLLRSSFEAVPVAYRERAAEGVRYLLPPLPPALHYTVETVDEGELRALTDDPRYLALLVTHSGAVPAEQLIPAHVRAVYAARGFDLPWLERAAREISRLFKSDYDRLLPILEAIDPES